LQPASAIIAPAIRIIRERFDVITPSFNAQD
jgi:hypothetical protein